MSGILSRFFGGEAGGGTGTPGGSTSSQGQAAPNNGGIEHRSNGSVTQLPTGNPQQVLNGGNGNGGNGGNQHQQQQQEPVDPISSHLDSMAALWQTPVGADGKPIAPQGDPLAQPIFNFDPAKVHEQVATLDFTTKISPELLGKAASGDVDALRDALNQVARQTLAGSTINSGRLINDGFTTYSRNVDQALPGRIKSLRLQDATSENPILSHPAVKPMVAGIRHMIMQKLPHASADEIQAATEEYFTNIGAAFTAKDAQSQKAALQKTEDNTDWLKLLGN
jgi:hypothetical protein